MKKQFKLNVDSSCQVIFCVYKTHSLFFFHIHICQWDIFSSGVKVNARTNVNDMRDVITITTATFTQRPQKLPCYTLSFQFGLNRSFYVNVCYCSSLHVYLLVTSVCTRVPQTIRLYNLQHVHQIKFSHRNRWLKGLRKSHLFSWWYLHSLSDWHLYTPYQ